MYCYVLKNSVRSSVQLVCQKTTRRGTRISLDNSHGLNATHIPFEQILVNHIRINKQRLLSYLSLQNSALCTFYLLILPPPALTQVQYRSFLSGLGPAEKTRQCCQSQSTESPTYFRPLPSFLSEVFDLPGVA